MRTNFCGVIWENIYRPMKRHLLTTPTTDRLRVWPGDRWWPRFFLVPSYRIDRHSRCVTEKQHYSWELTYMFMTFSWFKGKTSLKVKGQPSSTCWRLHTRVVHHHQCCPVSVKHCSLGKFHDQLHSICWTPTSRPQQPFPAEQLMGTGVIQCLSHKNAALVPFGWPASVSLKKSSVDCKNSKIQNPSDVSSLADTKQQTRTRPPLGMNPQRRTWVRPNLGSPYWGGCSYIGNIDFRAFGGGGGGLLSCFTGRGGVNCGDTEFTSGPPSNLCE